MYDYTSLPLNPLNEIRKRRISHANERKTSMTVGEFLKLPAMDDFQARFSRFPHFSNENNTLKIIL